MISITQLAIWNMTSKVQYEFDEYKSNYDDIESRVTDVEN